MRGLNWNFVLHDTYILIKGLELGQQTFLCKGKNSKYRLCTPLSFYHSYFNLPQQSGSSHRQYMGEWSDGAPNTFIY